MELPTGIEEARALSDGDAESIMFAARWPDGFRCRKCGGKFGSRVGGTSHHEARYRCKADGCGKQVSLTAGTRMHHTHLPLQKWIIAYFVMASGFDELEVAKLRLELSAYSLRRNSPLLLAMRGFVDTEQEMTFTSWLAWCCEEIEGIELEEYGWLS